MPSVVWSQIEQLAHLWHDHYCNRIGEDIFHIVQHRSPQAESKTALAWIAMVADMLIDLWVPFCR
jgi:hypothetical protein